MKLASIMFAAWLLFLGGATTCWSDESEPLQVCEVLENVERYRGKMLTVEGWLTINWRNGVNFINETEERTVCPGLKGNRADWPGMIHLLWPSEKPDDGPVAFEEGPDPIWDRLQEIVKHSEVGIGVAVVVEGELRSRENIRIRWVDRDNLWRDGNGYGRNRDFPAELVIKRVVAIEPPIKVY